MAAKAVVILAQPKNSRKIPVTQNKSKGRNTRLKLLTGIPNNIQKLQTFGMKPGKKNNVFKVWNPIPVQGTKERGVLEKPFNQMVNRKRKRTVTACQHEKEPTEIYYSPLYWVERRLDFLKIYKGKKLVTYKKVST